MKEKGSRMKESRLIVPILKEKVIRDAEPLEEGKAYPDAGVIQALGGK